MEYYYVTHLEHAPQRNEYERRLFLSFVVNLLNKPQGLSYNFMALLCFLLLFQPHCGHKAGILSLCCH